MKDPSLRTHICGRLLISDAVGTGFAGVHEERHVGEAVAVVRVAATPEALVHEEFDLLLDLRGEVVAKIQVDWIVLSS